MKKKKKKLIKQINVFFFSWISISFSSLECSNENLQIKTYENEENDKMCSNAKEQEINKDLPSTSQQNNYKTNKPRIK